jgi:tetratricopeptide (TPR) repeat protein
MANSKVHDISAEKSDKSISSHGQSVEKDQFDLALDKIIEEYVDAKMQEDDPSKNLLSSPQLRRAKFAAEIRENLNATEVENQVTAAISVLENEGLAYFGQEDYQLLMDNLDLLYKQLNSINLSEVNHESLKSALSIPQPVLDLIFNFAIEKHNQQLLFDSLSLFAFLSILKDDEPEYAYRVGLVAQECERYDQALRAYQTASQIAPQFIGTHIFSIQCYLKIGQYVNALAELEKAREILKSSKVEEFWQKHLLDMEALLESAA